MAAPLSPAAPADRDTSSTLRLFDCLAPFFVDFPAGGTYNWSKIPFAHLERDGVLNQDRIESILPEFDLYIATMAALGYNAVAIDDLAHLVVHDFYPQALKSKLASYRRLYERLFATIESHGLKLIVITDYQFFNPSIEQHLSERRATAADLFLETVQALFETFPTVGGLILRMGEGDGVDVEGDFKSQLTIRRPRDARALLKGVLPLFEARDKLLIFRTWTLGAYPIGDLMWNRRTYDAVFRDVSSPNLIISIKYGDTDFFRYLEVNPLFFHGPHQKIVEFQCRREYEGMGEYPSFVGWLHAGYLAALRAQPCNLVGMYAIQAGGWAPFHRLAFCGDSSLWNELNTFATVKLFADEATVEEVVAEFCRWRGIEDIPSFLRLLKLADEVIDEGLYIREFATHAVYFRRVRIPPLVWVFWNNVTITGLVGLLHRYLVRDKPLAVAEGYRAVEKIQEMTSLAEHLGLDTDGLTFQHDTFSILARLREVLLGVETAETRSELINLIAAYRQSYADGYRFDDAPTTHGEPSRSVVVLFQILLRRQQQYRRSDHLFLNRYVSRCKAYIVRRQQSKLPRFVDKQGMTADVLLR